MHEVVYPNDVRMCQFEATFCLAPELVERCTIVLAAVRPSEQMPRIGWRVPSAASSQALSSGGTFTRKHSTKNCLSRQRASNHEERVRAGMNLNRQW